MDTIFVCFLRIVIYIIVLSFGIFTILFVKKSISLRKNIKSSILFILLSFLLPYMILFYGTVQNIHIDYPFLCESYEQIKTNIIDNGEKIRTSNNVIYCLEGSSDEMIYSISFVKDYEESVSMENINSGTINGVHYTVSPLVAQRERQLAYSFTGVYSGEIILIKDNEQIVIDYSICKNRWYNILFVSTVPDIDIAEAIANQS